MILKPLAVHRVTVTPLAIRRQQPTMHTERNDGALCFRDTSCGGRTGVYVKILWWEQGRKNVLFRKWRLRSKVESKWGKKGNEWEKTIRDGNGTERNGTKCSRQARRSLIFTGQCPGFGQMYYLQAVVLAASPPCSNVLRSIPWNVPRCLRCCKLVKPWMNVQFTDFIYLLIFFISLFIILALNYSRAPSQ